MKIRAWLIAGLAAIWATAATAQVIQYPPTTAIRTSASSILASSLVVKATPGFLYGFQVSADSTLSGAAWWIMIYDATVAPGDGTITPTKCYAMASGVTSFSASFSVPINFATGITIGVSTAGCFTKTASVHAYLSGDFQ